LTNGDVKLALLGHYDTRHFLVKFLAAEDLLGSESSPFGFDLAPIVRIRRAISAVVELPPTPRRGARHKVLDTFRQELIFVTAAAARDSSLDLAMQLYLALMALHDREAETNAYLPDDAKSAAGEYLMRCLAVQASYSQFKTYRSLLLQFLKVVHTIKVPCNDKNARIDQRFIKANATSREALQAGLVDFEKRKPSASTKALDPVSIDVVHVGNVTAGSRIARQANGQGQATGGVLWLLAGVPDDEVEAIVPRASADSGGKAVKVVRLVDGSAPGWAPSRQGLTLFLPTKGRGLSAEEVLLAWSNADKAQPGAKDDGGPRASLEGALVNAKWGALVIFEGLLNTIEKLEQPTEQPTERLESVLSKEEIDEWTGLEAKLQADLEAKQRAERKIPYGRLEEALRLLLVPAWSPVSPTGQPQGHAPGSGSNSESESESESDPESYPETK
jgi:hypothetical protein